MPTSKNSPRRARISSPCTSSRITRKRRRCAALQAGISLNPDTPPEALLPYLDEVDLVLVMSVFPGFGGQKFIADVLPKIRRLAQWREQRRGNWRIEVDGGVDETTAPRCLAAGADTLVAGTAFFNAPDKARFIRVCRGE